jgi:hypothetical protein
MNQKYVGERRGRRFTTDVSYLYRLPAGIAGDINRAQSCVVRPEVITTSGNANAPLAYGLAVVVDPTTGQVRTVAAGDTAISGFLARPFPTNSTTNGLGVATPPTNGPCDLMVRGFMSVLLGGATSAINFGQAYVWTAASTGLHVQGQLEAANPGANGFAIPGAFFSGPADANGNTEVQYLP